MPVHPNPIDSQSGPRKRWRRLALAVGLFACLGFGAGASERLWAGTSSAEILVILSSDSAIYEEALAGIQGQSKHKIAFEYWDVIESAGVDPYFRQLQKSRYKLIIALGSKAARAAYERQDAGLPVVFSMVDAPRTLGIPLERLCGISSHIPVSLIFSTYKEIRPKSKFYYIFYSSKNNEYIAREGEYMDHALGAVFRPVYVRSSKALLSALKKAAEQGMDAVHVISDPLYTEENFLLLSGFAKKHKIIVSSTFAELVNLGSTFGYSPNFARLGVLSAEMSERILSGTSTCSDEGIRTLRASDFFFYLNREFAGASGLKLPEHLVERAALVRRFKAGIELVNAKKWKAARVVFEYIQKRDPKNEAVLAYLELVIKELTGKKTQKLMELAKASLERERFTETRGHLRQVLLLNPRFRPAREGLLELSRREEGAAERLERQGRPYDAIRMFQQALQDDPANNSAKRKLESLRHKLSAKIPETIDRGRAAYEVRNYRLAIQTFRNVLLIAPGNKIASEYLRLSEKKQSAIERLLRKSH